MAIFHEDKAYEGTPIEDAMRELESLGAAVVGLNCARGPKTMLPTLSKIKKSVKVNVSCIVFNSLKLQNTTTKVLTGKCLYN